MTQTRRLAAVMAIDVVGYSRLMGEDEAGTARAVREHRDAVRPIVAGAGGRVVKTMGDGLLLEYPSVVAAVESAVAIQKLMVRRNAEVPDAKRIVYRIGVNLGDVLIEGDDILGDGVNIAARLEAACEPGGVLISNTAFEHTRGKLDVEFVDLGETTLKNIARPVRVYALSPAAVAASADRPPATLLMKSAAHRRSGWAYALAACAFVALAAGWFGWRSWSHSPAVAASTDLLASAPRLSLVVLPFENLSSDPDQNYFADGITDDLTTDLSHLSGSFVIARNTAFTYKGKPVDVKQVGRELGVRYVLEGSVRRVGETITVNAQLISTETGAHVWADRFDGERAKLGQLQVEVVARLANSLGVELVKAESLRAMRERSNNLDAGDFSMRGWAMLNSNMNKAVINDAATLFERALALDGQNVSAMIGLTFALTFRVNLYWSEDRAGDLARAEAASNRALELEPENSLAHVEKGYVIGTKRQWAQAIAENEKAIADDRNNAHAHAMAGYYKVYLRVCPGTSCGIA